ncbi:sugar MFS transporter [Bacteroidota bacterium]
MYSKGFVFTAACIGMLLFGIVLISLGSILPAITSKFVLDEITAGSLTVILPFGILVGSIIFGPIVDRYGYKYLLIICTVVVALGLEGIAFANSFFLLQLSIFLIGFGGGVINGGTNALVTDISSEGRGANLSLLGVFFGIGALGMPAILGLLYNYFSHESIIAGIGLLMILPVLYFFVIKFPAAKQPQGIPLKKGLALIKDSTLILMGLILFFESGMEGVVNNWTTTYLQNYVNVSPENALLVLSLFVLGMTVTRLILGFVLKKIPPWKVLFVCIGFVFVGSIFLMVSQSIFLSVLSLILLGVGLAAGFPVILGYVGDMYSELSGTAFSIVFVIALVGNMIINYLMGFIAHSFGIEYYSLLLLVGLIIMTVLLISALKKIPDKNKI